MLPTIDFILALLVVIYICNNLRIGDGERPGRSWRGERVELPLVLRRGKERSVRHDGCERVSRRFRREEKSAFCQEKFENKA